MTTTPALSPSYTLPGADRFLPHSHDGAARTRRPHEQTFAPARRDRPDRPVPAAASDGSNFTGAALKMVHGALKAFRQDIKATLNDFGLGEDQVGKLIKSLIHPIKEALRSGADFSAQVVVAAASQVTAATQGGISTAIDLVAKGIDITVNHGTGEMSVTTASIELHARETVGADQQQPQFVDFADDDGSPPRDIFGQIDSYLRSLADAFDLAGPGEDGSDEDSDGDDGEIDQAGTTAPMPTASTPSARITIEMVEHLINGDGERLTRLRLDAVIPLMIDATNPDPAPEPVADSVADSVVESAVNDEPPAPVSITA